MPRRIKRSQNPGIPQKYCIDKNVVTFLMLGPANKEGMRSFDMIWWNQDYHLGARWWSQCYRAIPQPHIVYWQERNKNVQIVEI